MNFLSQGDGNNSSTYNTNLGGWYLHVLISHPHTVHSTCCVCWLMFSHSLEMKEKKKNLWKLSSEILLLFLKRPVASVSSLSDSRRMSCQCLPLSRIQLRGWEVAKKRPGLRFPGRRLLLGVILRCQVAANVLAANGREASKFTLTAECNCAEHLLMNESAAH